MEIIVNSVNFARRGFAARQKLPRFECAAPRKTTEFCTRIFCERYYAQPIGSRKHGLVANGLHSNEQQAFAKLRSRMRMPWQTLARMKKAHGVQPGLLKINSFAAVDLICAGAARREPRPPVRFSSAHSPTHSLPHRLTYSRAAHSPSLTSGSFFSVMTGHWVAISAFSAVKSFHCSGRLSS